MPAIVQCVKHRGQYHVTTITNISAISRALRIDVRALVKHFVRTLCTQAKLTAQNVLEIKGAHCPEALNRALRLFINRYILCKTCDLPELQFAAQKSSKAVRVKCCACGRTDTVRVVDDRMYANLRTTTTLLSKKPKCTNGRDSEALLSDALDETTSQLDGWSDSVGQHAVEMRRKQELGTAHGNLARLIQ